MKETKKPLRIIEEIKEETEHDPSIPTNVTFKVGNAQEDFIDLII